MALVMLLLLVPALAVVPTAVAAPPPNDDFGTATIIPSLPYTNTTNTTQATTAADDPTCGGLGRDRSVWYNFTATSDVVVRVNTTGSNYHTIIGIFRGPRGAFTSSVCANDPVGGGETNVSLSVPAGVSVHIMIATPTGGTGGNLTVNVGVAPPPPPRIELTMLIGSPLKFSSNRASVTGVAELSRTVTGTLCVHARLSQPFGLSITFGSGYRCFAVNNASSASWSVNAFGSRAWRTGGATAYVTGYFYAAGLADSDTRQRSVTLVPA